MRCLFGLVPILRRLRLKYRPNLISLAGGMKELPITKPEARAIPTPVSGTQSRCFVRKALGWLESMRCGGCMAAHLESWRRAHIPAPMG